MQLLKGKRYKNVKVKVLDSQCFLGNVRQYIFQIAEQRRVQYLVWRTQDFGISTKSHQRRTKYFTGLTEEIGFTVESYDGLQPVKVGKQLLPEGTVHFIKNVRKNGQSVALDELGNVLKNIDRQFEGVDAARSAFNKYFG